MSTTTLIILGLCVLCLALMMGWYRSSNRISRSNKARQIRARVGEDEADHLLRSNGFRVLDHQIPVTFTLFVDDEPRPAHNRCDRMVERDGLIYAADVKTGPLATNPGHPPTRRQLLEYLLVHDVDGVLLIDMDARKIHEIRFDFLETP